MKYLLKNIIWIVFLFLILGNGYIFVSGIKISEEINFLEKDTTKLHQENINLEKKIDEVGSLQYTASMAARMNFTEKPTPLVIESAPYAYKN